MATAEVYVDSGALNSAHVSIDALVETLKDAPNLFSLANSQLLGRKIVETSRCIEQQKRIEHNYDRPLARLVMGQLSVKHFKLKSPPAFNALDGQYSGLHLSSWLESETPYNGIVDLWTAIDSDQGEHIIPKEKVVAANRLGELVYIHGHSEDARAESLLINVALRVVDKIQQSTNDCYGLG